MANYDQLVADILSIEDLYNAAEWAVIETLVTQLLEEAHFFGVEPRDHAAERLAALLPSGVRFTTTYRPPSVGCISDQYKSSPSTISCPKLMLCCTIRSDVIGDFHDPYGATCFSAIFTFPFL